MKSKYALDDELEVRGVLKTTFITTSIGKSMRVKFASQDGLVRCVLLQTYVHSN